MYSPKKFICYKYTLTLGDVYKIQKHYFKFIKVTPKGYNLLNLKTNKCLLKKHLYDRKLYGKRIPFNHKEIKTWLPDWLTPIKVDKMPCVPAKDF